MALVASIAIASGCASETKSKVLLAVSGTGITSTPTFTASVPWSIAWSFDCGEGSGGSFFLDVYNASDRPPDFKNRGVDAEGEQKAADTSHFANPGTFYLEITTPCAWTVRAFE